jgi:hypothetical protein
MVERSPSRDTGPRPADKLPAKIVHRRPFVSVRRLTLDVQTLHRLRGASRAPCGRIDALF